VEEDLYRPGVEEVVADRRGRRVGMTNADPAKAPTTATMGQCGSSRRGSDREVFSPR
jgi:hypothetical protein